MRYYSPGKLLITAEYAVLDGAKALAIPTKLGQSLEVSAHNPRTIRWKALKESGELWFEAHFIWEEGKWIAQTDGLQSETLQQIFQTVRQLNPESLDPKTGYDIITQLEFPTDWGLGSSSTLINNVANWCNVSAFKLQDAVFGGSGYDIASAKSQGPLFYTKTEQGPVVEPVQLQWPFTEQLYFLHLKEKQNSRASISGYRQRSIQKDQLKALSKMTDQFAGCTDLDSFVELMNHHEELIAQLTGLVPVQKRLFADFHGQIKSLGGWGGDLVLVASSTDPTAYFMEKGYPTVLSYAQLIP